uniref:Uncharacterized protein n=1 Tax=Eutreptiella gymnastica TaxID=73025 RepID=A0A7S4LHM5_9EUGL
MYVARIRDAGPIAKIANCRPTRLHDDTIRVKHVVKRVNRVTSAHRRISTALLTASCAKGHKRQCKRRRHVPHVRHGCWVGLDCWWAPDPAGARGREGALASAWRVRVCVCERLRVTGVSAND